jgi:hypothetical protein
MTRWAFALALLPAMAMAEEPLSAEAFAAYATGKTMTYARDGRVWGREQYLAGRQVIWAFEGQDCKRGLWHEEAPGLICFVYDDDPGGLECWRFYLRDGRLVAWSDGSETGEPLAVVEETPEPMACPGPDVGV